MIILFQVSEYIPYIFIYYVIFLLVLHYLYFHKLHYLLIHACPSKRLQTSATSL